MQKGKIISEKGHTKLYEKGEFYVDFNHTKFGPYDYAFKRQVLYFNDELQDRGSIAFPLRDRTFGNTEIFLETNDVVICVGERGGFSGGTKTFIDIVNISRGKKIRIFTNQVPLIYNTKNSIEINYKKGRSYVTESISIKTLKVLKSTPEKLSSFFKLLYNHSSNSYENLVFTSNNTSEKNGYFTRKEIPLPRAFHKAPKPEIFIRKDFCVTTNSGDIDIWESTLENKLIFKSS